MRTLILALAACTVTASPALAQVLSPSVILSGQDGVSISQLGNEARALVETSPHDDAFRLQLFADLAERGVRSEEALLDRQVFQAWNGDVWEDEARNLYTYYDGVQAQMINQEFNNSLWVDMRRANFSYAEGQLVEEIREWREEGEWRDVSRVSYSYADQHLTERLAQVWSGSEWINSVRLVFSVDDDGRRTFAVYQVWDGAMWDDDERYFYAYSEAGVLQELRSERWNGTAWSNAWRETGNYEAGLLSNLLGQVWNGATWVGAYRLFYSHDANGNRITTIQQAFIDAEWVNVVRTLFEYRGTTASEQEVAPSALAFSVYPNPAVSAATLGFELEQAGTITWSAFDVTGRRVAGEPERTVSAGAHAMGWDLRDLPAGVYVIQLRTERQVTTQRIVVVK
ncbi:MAG: T9SS type A sorting domain-containing protein [Rhodothermales bacterium]